MLYTLSRKIQNNRVFMTLLFAVFFLCSVQNGWLSKSVSQLNSTAAIAELAENLPPADLYHTNGTSQSELNQPATTDKCEKTSCLLKQVQLDLPDILPALIILVLLLGSAFSAQKPLKLKPQWPPKRRRHSLFCCFLE